MIKLKDVKEVIQILRDVQTYMFIQSRNDDLGKRILDRIDKVILYIDKEE